METKKALITGITGQDGSYLAELLLSKGYEVHGLVRKAVRGDWGPDFPVGALADNVHWIKGDIRSSRDMYGIFDDITYYDEVYHLAAQSDVAYSFSHPDETYDINITGTLNLLNAIKDNVLDTRIYFAGSSEMFGQPPTKPQDELYPMKPRSPYAVSKLSGYWSSKVYRDAYNMFISCGILYNHESPRRGHNFVTRKIAHGVAEFVNNFHQPFKLGNLDARKDWGYAPEYVEGMWRMLQQDKPDDFILATNEMHTVREFLEEALRVAGIEALPVINPTNQMTYEYGMYQGNTTCPVVEIDANLYRPSEADNYQGDYNKAKNVLGWEPKTKFKELVKIMVEAELVN